MSARRRILATVVAAALALCGLSATDAASAAPPSQLSVQQDDPTTGAITGVVDGADTGAGIADIDVGVYIDGQDDETGDTSTDSTGSYTIDGLAPGSYTVQFFNLGTGSYLSQWWSGETSRDTADEVVVTAGATSTANATLAVAGTITGTVTSALNGSVAQEIYVRLYSLDGVVESFGNGVTGLDGTYSLTNIPPGTYGLRFDGSDPDSGEEYVSQWNGGTADEASSTKVVVAGDTQTIDQTLVPTGQISGSIHGPGGSDIPDDVDFTVKAIAQDGSVAKTVDAGAGFDVYGLTPGRYRLEIDYSGPDDYLKTYWAGASTLADADPITVAPGQITTVNPVMLVKVATITGRVTDAVTGEGIPGVSISYSTGDGGWEDSGDVTDSNGDYSVTGIPTGNVQLEFEDADGAYAYQYWNDKSSASDASELAVTGGQTTSGIDVQLAAAASISGVLTSAGSGDPASGVRIRLYDSRNEVVEDQSSNEDGTYTFTNLPADTYRVEFDPQDASDHVYAFQWWNDATTMSSATTIQLNAGDSANDIDAALEPAKAITGTVTDSATGEPAGSIVVKAFDSSGVLVESTLTNATSGTYSIPDLASAKYTLDFSDPSTGYGELTQQWWSGKSSQAAADPVTVGTSDVVANANLQPGGVIAGTLSGRPTDSDITLDLFNSSDELVATTYDGPGYPNDSHGNAYNFVGLPAGTYKLRMTDQSGTDSPEWYGGGSTFAGASAITVSSGTTTTVNPVMVATSITPPHVSVFGNANVGQNLELEQSGPWEPTGVSVSFQWLRDGTAIPGATDDDYDVVAGDIGHQLSISVTGALSGYATVTTTSDPTAAVGLGILTPTYVPAADGFFAVGQTLTADSSPWGPGAVPLSYQWNNSASGPIAGATNQTYTLAASDLGDTITVTVTGTKANYTTVSHTSSATPVILASLPTVTPGTVAVTGDPAIGKTLNVDPGTWSPDDTVLSFQWNRDGIAIPGATNHFYVLTSADDNEPITVTVTGDDPGYNSANATSDAVFAEKAITKSPTPTVSGSALVGSTLTASAGTWSPSTVTLHYQWNRDGNPITGATSSKYVPVTADGGTTITVTVTGSKTGYLSVSKTSTGKSIPPQLTATPVPTITGTAAVGQTLTAAAGDWTPDAVTLTYQWKLSGTAIKKATTSTYLLTSSDAGKAITVTVTGTLTGYQTVSKTSASVTPPKLLTKSPTPTISGSAIVGSTLTASAGTWSPSKVTLAYQWNSNGTPIDGATTSKYVPVAADAGAAITVTVTGSKTGYASISRTSKSVTETSAAVTPTKPQGVGLPEG